MLKCSFLYTNVLMKNKKVFLGLSGGVDSSVSAALLKKQGFDVTAVFIKTWQPDWIECTWKDDRRDAMRIAAILDIPFLTFDFEEEYKKEVVDYMVSEYKKGRTPNPDVMCNKYIKFGSFFKKAKELGADFVATGHYARNINESLYAGVDKEKDQSYFLWALEKDQLKEIIFPLGGYKKSEVRKMAKFLSLPTFDKKDSQGICFLGDVDMEEFLSRFLNLKSGDVLNESGNVIGKHKGALLYTLGQRHGFDILEKGTENKPLFVVDKDLSKNTIIVSEKEKKENIKEVCLENMIWRENINEDKKYQARFRYRQPLVSCWIKKEKVVFENLQKFITPGQSLVVYDEEKCLGGGIIK